MLRLRLCVCVCVCVYVCVGALLDGGKAAEVSGQGQRLVGRLMRSNKCKKTQKINPERLKIYILHIQHYTLQILFKKSFHSYTVIYICMHKNI